MNLKAARAFLALIASFSLLASCDDDYGIFAMVAAAKDISSDMTAEFEDATPNFVALLGTTYYTGIPMLWKENGTGWEKVGVSDIGSGTMHAVSGVSTGSTMYLAFRDATNDAFKGVWSTTDGSSWTRVDSGFPASGEYFSSLLMANDQLFAVTTDVKSSTDDFNAYSVYYLNGGTFALAGVDSDSTIGQPTSVAWDGTNYLFTAGGRLLRGTSALNDVAAITGPDDLAPYVVSGDDTTYNATTYGGVCALPTAGSLLVTGRAGSLYRTDDHGATWLENSTSYTDSDTAYSFSVPSYVSFGTAPTIAVIVGTDSIPRSSTILPTADGYLEFDATSGFDPSTNPSATDHGLIASVVNFGSSLDGLIVNAMPVFTDGSTRRVFALTSGDGLWSNTYSDGDWGEWVRE